MVRRRARAPAVMHAVPPRAVRYLPRAALRHGAAGWAAARAAGWRQPGAARERRVDHLRVSRPTRAHIPHMMLLERLTLLLHSFSSSGLALLREKRPAPSQVVRDGRRPPSPASQVVHAAETLACGLATRRARCSTLRAQALVSMLRPPQRSLQRAGEARVSPVDAAASAGLSQVSLKSRISRRGHGELSRARRASCGRWSSAARAVQRGQHRQRQQQHRAQRSSARGLWEPPRSRAVGTFLPSWPRAR